MLTWSPAAEKATAQTGAAASNVCTDRLLRMSHSCRMQRGQKKERSGIRKPVSSAVTASASLHATAGGDHSTPGRRPAHAADPDLLQPCLPCALWPSPVKGARSLRLQLESRTIDKAGGIATLLLLPPLSLLLTKLNTAASCCPGCPAGAP